MAYIIRLFTSYHQAYSVEFLVGTEELALCHDLTLFIRPDQLDSREY
jgi:hypothetical protein